MKAGAGCLGGEVHMVGEVGGIRGLGTSQM